MGRHLIKILFALLLTKNALPQSYGLAFNSHEAVPEKRTDLETTPGDSLCFSGAMRVEFDMNLISGNHVYFGYILRVLDQGDNIDLIYDQKAGVFRITEGKTFTGISFSLDSARLYYQWNSIGIRIDPSSHKLELKVNGKSIGIANIAMPGNCYKFLWGANDDGTYQTRDIPPMRLREIKLFEDDNLKYHWPLNNLAGDTSLDVLHGKTALIKNPVWIRPGHRHWEMTGNVVLRGNAVAAFDQKHERLIIAGTDSIIIYDLQNFQTPVRKLAVDHENILRGSQGIYDTLTAKLYNVFVDQKKVASWQIDAPRWDVSFDSALTEYWHPNKFISPLDTSLYIIGGYGQLKYKNLVQRYHFATKKWETVRTAGDFFPPRYLAALGLNATGDTAYIMGGYGSPTGDQMLNPANYYDLFAYSIRARTFKKLFDLDSVHSKFTFANSLVIDGKNQQYYGLAFPNDSFHSSLRLIRGSLKDPHFHFLGEEIPFSFYDIQSFADLFYAPKAGRLIAVVFYASAEGKDKITDVKTYAVDFPPEYLEPAIPNAPSSGWIRYVILALILGAVLLSTIFLRRRSRKRAAAPPAAVVPVTAVPAAGENLPAAERPAGLPAETFTVNPEPALPPARIFLFGQFQVFDKEGEDITQLFTPVLRELFLLILIYTIRKGRGITAEELTEILWLDKGVKDAKNNRSVNIAKLKSILERLGESLLVRQSGFWQFQAPPAIYVDYQKYQELMSGDKTIGWDFLRELMSIVKKGAFLTQTEYNWLDDIKVDISNAVIEICLKFIRDTELGQPHPEFVIELANCIFQFDQLNEDALEYKCKSLVTLKRLALANKSYDKFAKDYKDIYGEPFSRTFHDIVSAPATDTSRK